MSATARGGRRSATASNRAKLDEIADSCSILEDPRSHINRRHPLPSILVIAVLAVLAGAARPTAIARWAEFEEDLLTGILELPNGIPGKDVFRRVLMALWPAAFEAGSYAWIDRPRNDTSAETGVDRPIISLGGEAARRSHDAKNGLGALHVVTAWAGEYRLTPGQQVCEEKSNEIAAIPELLRRIDVRGGVVTIDAMGRGRQSPRRSSAARPPAERCRLTQVSDGQLGPPKKNFMSRGFWRTRPNPRWNSRCNCSKSRHDRFRSSALSQIGGDRRRAS